MTDAPWLLANEFAQVRLRLDRSGHDVRLAIEDMATGRTILLDAAMLAQIARLPAGAMDRIMDPASAAD